MASVNAKSLTLLYAAYRDAASHWVLDTCDGGEETKRCINIVFVFVTPVVTARLSKSPSNWIARIILVLFLL